MKTLQECKDEVARQHGKNDWVHLESEYVGQPLKNALVISAEIYAKQFIDEIKLLTEQRDSYKDSIKLNRENSIKNAKYIVKLESDLVKAKDNFIAADFECDEAEKRIELLEEDQRSVVKANENLMQENLKMKSLIEAQQVLIIHLTRPLSSNEDMLEHSKQSDQLLKIIEKYSVAPVDQSTVKQPEESKELSKTDQEADKWRNMHDFSRD